MKLKYLKLSPGNSVRVQLLIDASVINVPLKINQIKLKPANEIQRFAGSAFELQQNKLWSKFMNEIVKLVSTSCGASHNMQNHLKTFN